MKTLLVAMAVAGSLVVCGCDANNSSKQGEYENVTTPSTSEDAGMITEDNTPSETDNMTGTEPETGMATSGTVTVTPTPSMPVP